MEISSVKMKWGRRSNDLRVIDFLFLRTYFIYYHRLGARARFLQYVCLEWEKGRTFGVDAVFFVGVIQPYRFAR